MFVKCFSPTNSQIWVLHIALLYISLFSGFWKIINLVGQLNDMSPLWISREVTFFSDPLLLLSPRWNIISLKYIFPIETVVGENQTKIQIGGFKPPSTLKCSRLWWLWEEPRWGGQFTSENTESNFIFVYLSGLKDITTLQKLVSGGKLHWKMLIQTGNTIWLCIMAPSS